MKDLNWIEKIRLRNKQRELSDRCVKVNRTDKIHLEVLRVCPTYYCNRNCSFCYSDGLQNEFKTPMSIEDFEFLCDWAKKQGYRSLRLLGGEPTVHPKFGALLDIAKRYRFTVSLSTNGFFDSKISSLFKKGFIESINFSYPQDEINPQDLELFSKNIQETIYKKIPVVISGVVYPDRDDWRKVLELAIKLHRRSITRFSMVLPGHGRHFSIEEFRDYLKDLAYQMMELSRYAYKNYVVFYFYRPIIPCIFKPEEIKFLTSISKNLFDTFCSCSCIDGNMLTVNPDLSCFPCPSLSIKGIKITHQISKEAIHQYFRENLTNFSQQPLMDECRTCQYFINYQNYLKNKKRLFSGLLCHGGCYQYRY